MQFETTADYLAQARTYLAEKDLVKFLQAVGVAEYIYQDEPQVLLATLMLTVEGLYEFNRYKEAFDVVTRALDLVEDHDQKYMLLRRKGILLGKLGKLDDAIAVFEEFLEGSVSPIWGINNLAWTYLYKHQLDPAEKTYLHQALDYCQQAIKLFSPNDPPELNKSVLVNLGNVYWHLEEYQNALQVFQDARFYVKDDPKVLNNIAATFVQLRQLEEAERYLDEAEHLAEASQNHFEAGESNLIHARIHEWILNDYMGAKDHFLIAFDKFNLANAIFEACKCFDNIIRLGDLLYRDSIDTLSQQLTGTFIHHFGKDNTIQLERRKES